MKEFAVYTAARIGLFIASYAVIAGVYMLVSGSSHVPLFWPFVLAALVSAVASYYLLSGHLTERLDVVASFRSGQGV